MIFNNINPSQILRTLSTIILLTLSLNASPQSPSNPTTPENIEFFENHIRPVLVEHCYECHNSHTKAKGDLALDFRAGLLNPDSPVVVIGKPDQSLLIESIRHDFEDLRMPKNGPKLSDQTINHFKHWIKIGLPDPRDKPPTKEKLQQITSWDSIFNKRLKWWSFQPLQNPPVPQTNNQSTNPIDQFLIAKLQQHKLQPAPLADKSTRLRRLTYTLTGLPPTVEQLNAFLNDNSPNAYEKQVDQLLSSPHFGERWARHWMDWYRYADSHGSEGDPDIPYAYQYRDYLIRALNQDIKYDQLIREHLAGDLLPTPRINKQHNLNESKIGIAQYRMVFHGFAPVDALDEQVRFTDNQIDVVTKATLGLTVSCARCHHHKFDPISQDDFYALYGIFASSRPGVITIDSPEQQTQHITKLTKLKSQIRQTLADAWLNQLNNAKDISHFKVDPNQATKDIKHPLHIISRLQQLEPDGLTKDEWHAIIDPLNQHTKRITAFTQQAEDKLWQTTNKSNQYATAGTGMLNPKTTPGDFTLNTNGENIINQFLEPGLYSNRLSNKHNAHLSSPRFKNNNLEEIWVRIAGEQNAKVRYVVQNYPRGGTVYPISNINSKTPKWIRWNVNYWRGDHIYIEATTAGDHPIGPGNQERSWFGITHIYRRTPDQPTPPDLTPIITPMHLTQQHAPTKSTQAFNLHKQALITTLQNWKANKLTPDQSAFLAAHLQYNLLPNSLNQLPNLKPLLNQYRTTEAQIKRPTRAPGVVETTGFDQPLYTRGNHKKPDQIIKRRFLDAFNPEPFNTPGTGRLQLANQITSTDNPLFARVIVNRLWHHIFGQGIVSTTDNFGRLGEKPTHPQLLDYLANHIKQNDWSLKHMIKLMVMSDAFQRASQPTSAITQQDPNNELLAHFPIKRLEAEAIRDGIITITTGLDTNMFGPPTNPNSNRRSLYLKVKRNNLAPFLTAFDMPAPHTTQGRRDATNVPAQSLTMLNSPFVNNKASAWANRILKDNTLNTPENRINRFYLEAFSRPPTKQEITEATNYLTSLNQQQTKLIEQRNALTTQLNKLESQKNQLIEQTRTTLKQQPDQQQQNTNTISPPIAHFDFKKGPQDQIGNHNLKLHNGAKIQNNALILNGQSWASTSPINQTITEKTLVVWLQLDNLNQRAGGALTLQTLNGNLFDSIVYAEQAPQQWLPGSNSFARTQPLGGPPESEAHTQPTHIVLTYKKNGTIQCFRNGEPYGKPYRKAAPHTYPKNQSQLVLGLRHGTQTTPNRMLKGKIFSAQLFNRALTPEEIKAVFNNQPNFIGMKQILAAMSPAERNQLNALNQSITKLNQQLKPYQNIPTNISESQAYTNLAHAILNMKELIYLK